jgi:hypothetical protein
LLNSADGFLLPPHRKDLIRRLKFNRWFIMVESKFKFWSLLAITSSLLLFIALISTFFTIKVSNFPLRASIPLFIFILFVIAWLFFGEIRTKAITVKIEKNTINIRRFLGLGHKKVYDFSEFEGYKISILPSESQEYEYLYLLINRKKVIKISQFYHSNYSEIKQVIIRKTKNLGKETFSIINEVKEIFAA